MPGERELAVNPLVRATEVVLEKHQENNSVSWYEENRTAIDALNKFVEENGSFSDFQRVF